VRPPHILRANHGLESPWEAVWLDTETSQHQLDHNSVEHRLRFGWAAYRRRLRGDTWTEPAWFRFERAADFWTWIESLAHGRGRLYVFCHNAGFDLPVVDAFRELPARGWQLQKAVIECPPVILRWRKGKYSILALDTLNIWRLPLEKLGEQIGLAKLTMPAEDASAAEWDTYCQRDVLVIMTACLTWWKLLRDRKLGSFAPTLAGQAMRAYRHRFMTVPLFVDADPEANNLARMSYLGGRVECYRIGRVEGPIYRLDVNSMYPHVMRGHRYPVKLVGYTTRATIQDLGEWLVDRCVTAEVEIVTDEPVYPLVIDGRLCFPVGRFITTLASPELWDALDHGRVVRVLQAAVYESAEIFREFVDYFWTERRKAQVEGDWVTDRLLWKFTNSLYGKWGQRGRVYEEVGSYPTMEARAWVEYDADTGMIYKHRALGGLWQMWHDESESRESMPQISAHICSYARLYLWSLMCEAGRENVYYCDTDGLPVSQAGYDRLLHRIDPNTLGALKLEGTEAWAIYHGPKDYQYPSHTKTKGVRKRAHWVTDSDVVQEQWSSLLGMMQAGNLHAPTTRLITKHLARRYGKGTVTEDGLVLPFMLG
jgi:hypothetical protein